MDYLIIGILFFIGNAVWSVILLCFQSYAKKKGEDLATKEDIAEITKKIESVKDNYNKSLEKHKIELQKEFESYKYINELCNSIDKELLRKLVKIGRAHV